MKLALRLEGLFCTANNYTDAQKDM